MSSSFLIRLCIALLALSLSACGMNQTTDANSGASTGVSSSSAQSG